MSEWNLFQIHTLRAWGRHWNWRYLEYARERALILYKCTPNASSEILMRQVHEPEGCVQWTSTKIEAQVHYLVTILEHEVNT